jgi:hypothetical protein
MARLRFETVRDVIEAFPIAEHELNIEASDDPALDFLSSLTSGGAVDKAAGFCAFLLPRREAVWWGCRSVRTLVPRRTLDEEEGLRVAEEWVHDPAEDRRVTALELGMHHSTKLAIPIQPHQTARAVRAAILIAACRVNMADKTELMRTCLEDGIRIVIDETKLH